MRERIAVLGAGAWGVTLADLLARNGHEVRVWDPAIVALAALRRDRSHGKLPGLQVHESVLFADDFDACIEGTNVIVSVVPAQAVRSVCERLRVGGLACRLFVSCSKGIEIGSLRLPSQVFEEFFGAEASCSFAALSGPSHAEEVCRRVPTVVVSCSTHLPTAERVRDLFMMPAFRVYTQQDCLGVELGGALKNVIAIGAGICDGLGFGDNTKAALITRGLAEITRAGVAIGGQPRTFAGLAGLGDLVVTAMSRHSRNRQFGELLGKGMSPKQAQVEVGATVEGFYTARSAHELAAKLCVDMPICSSVYAVTHEGLPLKEALEQLLAREPKPEVY